MMKRQRQLDSLNSTRYTGQGQVSARADKLGSRSKVDSVMTIAQIANGVMDPYTAKVARVSSGYGSVERTVVAQPYDTVDLDFSAAPQSGAALVAGSQAVWVFRDPLHAYAVSLGNPTANSYVGEVYFQDEPPAVPRLTQTIYNATTVPVTPAYVEDSDPSNTGLNHPYGDALYAVNGAGRHAIWVDANTSENAIINFTIGASAPTVLTPIPYVVGYYWANGQWVQQGSEPFSGIVTGDNAAYITALRGYYAFEISQQPVVSAAAWDITCEVTYSSDYFGIRPCPQIESYSDSILRGRVSAASMLLTYMGATIYDAGQIAAAQFSGGTDWWETYDYTTIADQEGAYDGQLKQGLFGFLKPNDQNDFKMRDPFYGDNNGNIWTYNCDLCNLNQFMVCNINTSLIDGSYAAGKFRFRICYGFEYVPRGNWLQSLASANSSEEYTAAMTVVSKSTQFYANFPHLAAIAQFLLGAVRTVGAVAARAAPYIATAAQVADAVRTGANLVSKAATSNGTSMVVSRRPAPQVVVMRSTAKPKKRRVRPRRIVI